PHGLRAIPQLRLYPRRRREQAAGRDGHRPALQLAARADDDPPPPGLHLEHVQRLARGDADPAPLAGREAVHAGVAAERAPAGVDDLARPAPAAVPLEEGAVVAAADEADVLALRPPRRGQAGGARLGPRLRLGLLAQREPAPLEDGGRHRREHVRLILGRIGAADEQRAPASAPHARVVAGGQAGRADAVGELRQGGEAEAAVAAYARVRGQAGPEPAQEVVDDVAAELLAQVEPEVRHAEGMARLP